MKKIHLGFTLIELLVTIAVIVIVVLIGVPQFRGVMESNRMISSLNRLSGDLNYARSEAIKRAMGVTVCSSSDQATCNTTNWSSGWIIFTDQNKDATINQNDALLRIGGPMPAGLTLKSTHFDNATHVEFLADGRARDENGDGNSDGTFVLCPQSANAKQAKALNVNNLGRVSVATDTTSDGTVNDVTNADVTCP